jgi:hypothetical protein
MTRANTAISDADHSERAFLVGIRARRRKRVLQRAGATNLDLYAFPENGQTP